MKKLIILLVCFFAVTSVEALEYGVWTDEVADDNSEVVSSETRYRWYYNNTTFSPDYYIKDENDAEYPNIDYSDFVETEYSQWSDEWPISKFNRSVQSKPARRYRTLRSVRYLFLENFSGGFLTYNIAELNILIDNVKTPVNMNCVNCSFNFIEEVSDGVYSNSSYINNGGSLKIDLGSYYSIDQIKLELYMYDSIPITKRFDLYFNEGDTITDRNYAHKEISSYVVSVSPFQPEKYLIYADASYIVNPVYNDWIYIDGMVNATYCRQMEFLSLYRYIDLKYRYYKNERIYLDDYYKEMEDKTYVMDEASAKTFYLYEANDEAQPGESDEAQPGESDEDHPGESDEDHPGDSDGIQPGDSDGTQPGESDETQPENTYNNNFEIVPHLEGDIKKVLSSNSNPTSNASNIVSSSRINDIQPTSDILSINDYHTDKDIKTKQSITWLQYVNYRLLTVCSLTIIFLIIILLRIRHHNLSHQK